MTIAAARDHFTVFERENLTVSRNLSVVLQDQKENFALTLPLSSSSRGQLGCFAEFATLHASRIGDGTRFSAFSTLAGCAFVSRLVDVSPNLIGFIHGFCASSQQPLNLHRGKYLQTFFRSQIVVLKTFHIL